MKTLVTVATTLSPDSLARVDALALKHRETRSAAIRRAVGHGLPLIEAGHAINPMRLIMLLEYTQAALDLIVSREHPDVAEKLIDLAAVRQEQFHA